MTMALDLTGINMAQAATLQPDQWNEWLKLKYPNEDFSAPRSAWPNEIAGPTLSAGGPSPATPAPPAAGPDLSGMQGLAGYGRRTLADLYAGEGPYPKEALQATNEQTLRDLYPKVAAQGLTPTSGEVQRQTAEAILRNQVGLTQAYSAMRSTALGTQAPIEEYPLDFSLKQGALTGTYNGQPTADYSLKSRQLDIMQQEANARSEYAKKMGDMATAKFWGDIAGAIGQKTGLLDWLFGSQGGGTGTGPGGSGLGGTVTQGVLPSAVKWLGEQLGFGSNPVLYTPAQQAIIQSMTRQDAMVELMNTGQGGAAGAAGGGGGGIGGAAAGGVVPAGAAAYPLLSSGAPSLAPFGEIGAANTAQLLAADLAAVSPSAAGAAGAAGATASASGLAGAGTAGTGLAGAEGATTMASLGAEGAGLGLSEFAPGLGVVAVGVMGAMAAQANQAQKKRENLAKISMRDIINQYPGAAEQMTANIYKQFPQLSQYGLDQLKSSNVSYDIPGIEGWEYPSLDDLRKITAGTPFETMNIPDWDALLQGLGEARGGAGMADPSRASQLLYAYMGAIQTAQRQAAQGGSDSSGRG